MAVRPGRTESGRWVTKLAGPVCLALFFLLLTAPLAADTWYEDYDRGLKRLRKGDPAAAVVAFRAALAGRSSPGLRVRAYGVRYLDYFPHLMLGRAFIELEQFDEAVPALEASLAAGAAPAGEVRSLLQRAREELARQVSPPAVAVLEPPPAPAGVRAVTEGVGGRVRLNWSAVDGAEYYEIQSALAGEAWPADSSLRATETTALLSGLASGKIRGRIRAVSSEAGVGPWSAPATVTLAVGEVEAREAGTRFDTGRSSMAGGRFAEAAASLAEAAGVLKENTSCLAMLGTCHATLHFLKNDPTQRAEAQRWFRRLLEVDPSFRFDEQRVSPKIVKMLEDLR